MYALSNPKTLSIKKFKYYVFIKVGSIKLIFIYKIKSFKVSKFALDMLQMSPLFMRVYWVSDGHVNGNVGTITF